jgi:hypothetical protein
MENQLIKIPSLDEIVRDSEITPTQKANDLMVLLNQNPPKAWVKQHPMTKGDYLPIERVEYLLSRVFKKWWVEVKNVQCIANSVVCTVRLYVVDPFGNESFQEGVGASPIQTDKDKGAMDWNYAKADGVMKAAPSAESYAIKDAAEKFGKLFGKDLNRKEHIEYDTLISERWKQQ